MLTDTSYMAVFAQGSYSLTLRREHADAARAGQSCTIYIYAARDR